MSDELVHNSFISSKLMYNRKEIASCIDFTQHFNCKLTNNLIPTHFKIPFLLEFRLLLRSIVQKEDEIRFLLSQVEINLTFENVLHSFFSIAIWKEDLFFDVLVTTYPGVILTNHPKKYTIRRYKTHKI